MKKALLFSGILSLLILFNLSCKKERRVVGGAVEEKNTLWDFFIKNGVKSQFFTIDSETDVFLHTKGFTMLQISKNSFVTQHNHPVKGAVTIEVKEILDKKSMILTGIFPISEGKPLISGGEYFIRVTQNEKELKLAPGSVIELSAPYFLPAGTSSDTMLMFYAPSLTEFTTNWGIPSSDTSFLMSMTAFPPRAFNFPIPNLAWINFDHFLKLDGPKTKIEVKLGDVYNHENTLVFISFDGLNSAGPITYMDSEHIFSSAPFELPIGMNITLVVLSKVKGQYLSVFHSTTITDNYFVNLTLSPTTLDDFKLQLDFLP